MIHYLGHGRVRKLTTRLLAASALAVPFAAVHAQAQDSVAELEAQAQDDGTAEAGVITVTASRTARDGLQAPTPTQVFSGELIERQAAPTVMEVLNQNPAFKATRSPGANATNTSSPAQATADLRGLGGQRTLVLVNQSRVVPFAPASNLGSPTTTDLNLFPTLMIDRIDVVTGGASALYGSDAVSGVVNIIMKKAYDGAMITAQAGISEEGDYRTLRAGGIAGTSFADGRGDAVISVDYSDNNGVGDIYERDWGREEWLIVSNGQRTTPNTPGFGLPAFIISPNVKNNLSLGGRITTPNLPGLTNMTFNADGSMRPYQQGTISGGSTMIGGEGTSIIEDTALVPAVERFTAYGSVYYELSDALTAYIEGGYSKSIGYLAGVPMRLATINVRRDNAFIPAATRALLPAATQSFNLSRIFTDVNNNDYTITNSTPHAVAGLEGNFGESWNWDAHVSYGVNNYVSETTSNPITENLNFALDAVTGANGQIVCRAVRDGNPAAAGCQPLNPFGPGNASQAALDYIWGEGRSEVKYDQLASGVNVVGEPFSTWAGPVAVAVGAEYRRETQELTADPIGGNNGFLTAGNAVPYSGSFNVKEAYVEATVPLAEDLPFARTLDLNGAARYADYSSTGGEVAWKIGAVWEPVYGLNVRVARSRDIRAPAINELVGPGGNVRNNVTLAVDGVTKNAVIPQNTSAGNPNATPEFADTFTAGFAYRGSGALSGFGLSMDYYNIKIEDAITNLTTVNIAALCGQGEQYFCDLFTYAPDTATADPNDRIHTGLFAGSLNVGAFEQEGIDMTLSYRRDLGMLGSSGRYQMSASGTYIFHAYVDSGTGAAPVDRAGENGWANLGAIPRFRGNLFNTIGNDAFELTLQTIFISKGTQDNTYNTAPTNTINDNTVPSVFYFNLFGKLFFLEDQRLELFWAVNNLFDKDPPPTPYIILNGPVNGQYYDKVGRNYMAGVRFKL